MKINDIVKDIHQNAKDHGWWDKPKSDLECICLMHSELSEAVEEIRDNRPLVYFKVLGQNCPVSILKDETDLSLWNGEKLEGAATEVVDCIIRAFDWLGSKGVDVEQIINLKHQYNKTRPYKHGGKKY